jgi:O-antigen ligase
MTAITAILMIAIFIAAIYFLYKKPVYLLSCYLLAVPVLPPIPIGPVEITILDLLAIPTFFALVYLVPNNGWKLGGNFSLGFLFYTAAAIISFGSFTLQESFFSLPLFLRLIRLFEMFLPILLASYLLPKMNRRNILESFLIGGAIAAVLAVIFYLADFQLRPSQIFATGGTELFRAAGTHGDSGSFGTLAGLVLLVSVWVLIYITEPGSKFFQQRSKIIALIAAVTSATALILSLSRGGALLFILGFIIILLPLLKQPLRLIKVIMIGLAVILLGAAMFNTFIDNQLLSVGLDAFWNRITGLAELADDFDTVSSGRSYYWQESWQLFKSKPSAWPFGLGYKSLNLYYPLVPDNNFNQALFEMGLFGALALLAMLLLGLISGLKNLYRGSDRGILILGLWIGFISNMISADVLTYWHNIPPLFILLIYFSRSGFEESRSLSLNMN